jgi:superfamily II DNA or RNA helicase
MLVVRGAAAIEPDTSRRQADLFRRRFPGWGRYGLSAFYARSDDEVRDLGEDRLQAFEILHVYQLADVIAAGFEIVPTFRSPHATIAFYTDLDDSVARLLAVKHRTVTNDGHRKETP